MRESGASVIGKKVLGPEVNDSDATITGFVLQQVCVCVFKIVAVAMCVCGGWGGVGRE